MSIPFVSTFDFEYGQAAAVSPLISRVVANNPGPFTFTGTGTYLVGDHRGVAVIDPGPDDTRHIEAIIAAAKGPITDILVTHTHRDHSAGVPLLKEATEAKVHGYAAHGVAPHLAPIALDEGADFAFVPENALSDGDRVLLPSCTLTAVHTPGHTDNHLCFSLDDEGTLFTGDHVMGWSTTVIAPPDGDMNDYLESLERLLARPQDKMYLPTHGAPITDPHTFVRAIFEHRMARDVAILSQLETGAKSVKEIVLAVYTELDPRLYPAAGLNVMAHLDRHLGLSVQKADDGQYRKL